MSSPRSSLLPSSTPLTTGSASLPSSATNASTPLATTPQTGLSASSSEATVVAPLTGLSASSSQSSEATVVAPEAFDMDQIMAEFPQAEIVDYHQMLRDQVVSSSASSKALVIYEPPKAHISLENLQERLEEVIKNLAIALVKELNDLADAEIKKEQKEQASDSIKDEGEQMTVTPEQAPTHHESPKRTETKPAVTKRQAQLATKQVAQILNMSFDIPDELKVDDDTINKLVPTDETLRDSTAQRRKKYSFYDRLRGWKMECRMRLNSPRQLDKYYTHLQSKTVTRSVPEVVRFILYEVTPQQSREANKKRKTENPAETSSQKELIDEDLSLSPEEIAVILEVDGESYVEMWFRVAWTNFTYSRAVRAPSETKWQELKAEELKAEKLKAKTSSCKRGESTPKSEVEAADALIGLAAEESSAIKRQTDEK